MVDAVNVGANLRYHQDIYPSEDGFKLHEYLDDGQVPIRFDPAGKIDEGERNHPVLYERGIGIEREYLQFDRVEWVYGNRCLRVRVEVLV